MLGFSVFSWIMVCAVAASCSAILFLFEWMLRKHPKGLKLPFALEVFERMSYYGMASILVLYLIEKEKSGGLGWSEPSAKMLYAFYTGSVFITPILGGFIADRWLGARRTMLLGGIVIAAGHLLVAFQYEAMFFLGLGLIALGTGLLKPNVNTTVGLLYDHDDPLRSAGFNLVYMAINVGAALGPIICGTLAQTDEFKALLLKWHFNPLHSWHWGFAAAGVGMCLGLLMYWLHSDELKGIGDAPVRKPKDNSVKTSQPAPAFTRQEWHKLGALAFLFIAFTLYCAVSQQSGTSLTTFADKLTRLSIGSWHFKASHTLALNPIFIVALTPVFAWLWTFLNRRKLEPSEPLKFAIGMVFLALGACLLVPAASEAQAGVAAAQAGAKAVALASPFWLIGVYFFQTVAELFMSPVGNAAATRLAPSRFASLTMGVWYTSVGFGSFLAGYLSRFCNTAHPGSFGTLFGYMAAASVALAVVLLALTPKVTKLMSDAPQGKAAGAHG